MNGKKKNTSLLYMKVCWHPKNHLLQNKRTNPQLLIPENNDRFAADGEIK